MSSGRVAHAQAAPLSPLGKTGGLGKGLGLELVGLGPAEAWTRVGGAAGVSPNTAVQLDLGARWALRLPLSLDLTFRDGCVAYAAIAFTPGAVYRWRSYAAQRGFPTSGGGARLATGAVHHDFVRLPIVV